MKLTPTRRPRRAVATAGPMLASAVLATLVAAGCSSSGSSSATAPANTAPAAGASSSAASASAPAASGQKVTLSFWTWVPNMDKVVAIWNQAHPDIQVQVQTQAGGDAELTKLLTAAKGGNPPDLAQVEYQVLPTLVSNDYLANISQYDGSLKSDFPAGNWNQVTLGTSSLYALPQDAAPMALFYRADLFKKYGLTVPTTWAQFAADSAKLHSEVPGVYLGSFSSVDPGEFAGLTQQAGAQWWSASGSTWTVGIDGGASQKVASYWQGLIAGGGVDNQPQWTAAWNKGMNDGKYIAWVSDVWAPGDYPTTAPSGTGKWQMTELPQWTAGGHVVGNWGGSSTAVMAASKHQQAAAQFAAWLNTDPAATAALVSDGGIYPADTAAEAALSTPPSYFANQPNFWTLAKNYAAEAANVTWGPDVNVAYTEFQTAFGGAATSKGSFLSPLSAVQSAVVSDMKKSGFTVAARADVKQTRKRTAPRLAPYAFVTPAVVLYALVLLIPIGYTVYLSLQKTQVSGLGLGLGARRQVFAGLANYTSALTDAPFLSSLVRVVIYSLILVPVMLGLALLFALLLDARRVRFQRFSRLAIFLPYAVPIVIASLLWGFLYLPAVSPFPVILGKLGLSMPDLFSTHVALLSVANIGVWGGTGFNMIVMYTALRAVPSELYEAARIDGASQWQVALRVKIPMIAPALVLTGVFSLIATLQVFNEPQVLSPLTNTISPDWMPLMRVYDLAFNENNSYEAAALSVIIAAVMFVGSYFLLRVSNKRVFQGR